jgi:hypothetical protein
MPTDGPSPPGTPIVATSGEPGPSEQPPPDVWLPAGLEPFAVVACHRHAWEQPAGTTEVRLDSEPQGAAVVSPTGERLGATPVTLRLPGTLRSTAVLVRIGTCRVADTPAPAGPRTLALAYTTRTAGGSGWDPEVPSLVGLDALLADRIGGRPDQAAAHRLPVIVRGRLDDDARTVRAVPLTLECEWGPQRPAPDGSALSPAPECAGTVDVSGPPPIPVPNAQTLGTTPPVAVELVLTGFRSHPVVLTADRPNHFVRLVSVAEWEAEQRIEAERNRQGVVPTAVPYPPVLSPVDPQPPPSPYAPVAAVPIAAQPVPVAPPMPAGPSHPPAPVYGSASPTVATPAPPPPVPPPAESPMPTAAPQEPETSPWALQINAGFGAMFSGVGGGLEFGYVGTYVGFTGFFNLGYFVSAAGGTGGFGYGGGVKLLAGRRAHFGYLAFAYALAKAVDVVAGPDSYDDSIWGPSLLFGYQYAGNQFVFFADLGMSWVGDSLFEGDTISGAIFTLDVGIGIDLID